MNTDTPTGQTAGVPLEELRDSDLAHYEKAASAVNSWRNQIPQAIEAWYQRLIEARDTPQAEPPERASAPPPVTPQKAIDMVYPQIAGHAKRLMEAGETVAAERWSNICRVLAAAVTHDGCPYCTSISQGTGGGSQPSDGPEPAGNPVAPEGGDTGAPSCQRCQKRRFWWCGECGRRWSPASLRATSTPQQHIASESSESSESCCGLPRTPEGHCRLDLDARFPHGPKAEGGEPETPGGCFPGPCTCCVCQGRHCLIDHPGHNCGRARPAKIGESVGLSENLLVEGAQPIPATQADCSCGHPFESHTNAAAVQGCYECQCASYQPIPATPIENPTPGEQAASAYFTEHQQRGKTPVPGAFVSFVAGFEAGALQEGGEPLPATKPKDALPPRVGEGYMPATKPSGKLAWDYASEMAQIHGFYPRSREWETVRDAHLAGERVGALQAQQAQDGTVRERAEAYGQSIYPDSEHYRAIVVGAHCVGAYHAQQDAEARADGEIARLKKAGWDNHHNALTCPYCNPDNKQFASEAQAEEIARLKEQLTKVSHTGCIETEQRLREEAKRADEEIARLKAERVKLAGRAEYARTTLVTSRKVQARIHQLTEALRKHGKHDAGCLVDACFCGLSAALTPREETPTP